MTQVLKCQIMLKFSNMNESKLKKKVQVVVIAESCVLLFEFNNEIPNNYVGWQNITGAVEEDESFLEAAMRELAEEAGIESEVIDLKTKYEFFDRWSNQCVEQVFLCSLKVIPPVVLNEEHLNCKWVPLEEVLPHDYTFPNNFEAFLKAKSFIEQKS
jgi:8-oxo-dGTP pyrophosphatase MutT (NUDIX family)